MSSFENEITSAIMQVGGIDVDIKAVCDVLGNYEITIESIPIILSAVMSCMKYSKLEGVRKKAVVIAIIEIAIQYKIHDESVRTILYMLLPHLIDTFWELSQSPGTIFKNKRKFQICC